MGSCEWEAYNAPRHVNIMKYSEKLARFTDHGSKLLCKTPYTGLKIDIVKNTMKTSSLTMKTTKNLCMQNWFLGKYHAVFKGFP